MALHPVLTAADQARMSPSELLHFTDTPVAHIAAFRDFELDAMRERRRRRDAQEMAERRRNREIANFFRAAADAVLTMEAC